MGNAHGEERIVPVDLVMGDITRFRADALVNAANRWLFGGGGVDGAIHRAGGPAILAECRTVRQRDYPDGLPTGWAVATTAGNLPARWVIHTVGPIYDASVDQSGLLADAYANSLRAADEVGARTIAFPSISTGSYSYPIESAARTALTTVLAGIGDTGLDRATFVLFSPDQYQVYERTLAELLG